MLMVKVTKEKQKIKITYFKMKMCIINTDKESCITHFYSCSPFRIYFPFSCCSLTRPLRSRAGFHCLYGISFEGLLAVTKSSLSPA